jgi:hypothetical protein
MKLKKAFNQAIDFELTWYPQRYASAQIKITKASAKRDIRPLYEEYLTQDGDPISDIVYNWYGEGGEILASYDIEIKLLTLGS